MNKKQQENIEHNFRDIAFKSLTNVLDFICGMILTQEQTAKLNEFVDKEAKLNESKASGILD